MVTEAWLKKIQHDVTNFDVKPNVIKWFTGF